MQLAGAPLLVALGGLFALEFVGGAFGPMVARRVNEIVALAQRATILPCGVCFTRCR